MLDERVSFSLLPGILILAVHPARWLAESWLDDGYASSGEWIFLLVLAITLFSLSSARASVVDEAQRRRALLLLVSTALVRALSELLAINTLGALALTVDVYALGIGLGLNARRRAVSPLGLALLFSLSLPIERLLQRMVGYPLQLISAQAACSILGLWRGDLRCEGTQLSAGGAALSVDLPCSGAQGLVLLLVLVFALQALRWIRGPRLVPALAAAGLGAVLGNALRLVLIASAVGRGWPAEAEPLHSLLGLISLAVAAAPVLALVKAPPPPPPSAAPSAERRREPSLLGLVGGAVGSTAAALLIVSVPPRPVDVSAPTAALAAPLEIGAYRGARQPLSPKETLYVARFGGAASKTYYRGPGSTHALVLVRTRSPLRHLHGPDECLIGAGHTVKLIGVRPDDQTAVYQSRAPSGDVYRVEVSYYASDGRRASSPAEVIWSAFQRSGATWTMVERISPWEQCQSDGTPCADFDRSLALALDLPQPRRLALNQEPSP